LNKDDVFRLLVHPRALDFDATACRAEVAQILEADNGDGRLPVVSSEELCANPHAGALLEKELADRLVATLPGARVLIVIREQRAMLASTYKQYIRAGGMLSLDTYLSPASLGHPSTGLPDWRHFRYDALIRCYRERFGEDRVLVLPYEHLRNQPADFVTRLIHFTGRAADAEAVSRLPQGRDDNTSLTALGTNLKRKLNRYLAQVDRMNPEPWFGISAQEHRRLLRSIRFLERRAPSSLRRRAETRLHDTIQEWAGDRFRESNELTNEWLEADLATLGYAL